MIFAAVAAPSTPPLKDYNHDAAPMIDRSWKRRNNNKIVRKSEKTKQIQTKINQTRMNIGIGASDRLLDLMGGFNGVQSFYSSNDGGGKLRGYEQHRVGRRVGELLIGSHRWIDQLLHWN